MNSSDADQTNSKLPDLPVRSRNSHKGDSGRAFLLGGSAGMPGAIGLAGMACLRSGAGLVTLAVSSDVIDTVASYSPNYMTLGWSMEGESVAATSLAAIRQKVIGSSAVAIGPGLGLSAASVSLLQVVSACAKMPMIVDADGLNAMAAERDLLRNTVGPRILTPHPGEFARLVADDDLARKSRGDDGERVAAAGSLAACDPSGRTIVVLKGHHTVVSDGRRFAVNQTGNPGMATGGSGDVLTGIILGLVCQGLAIWDAARLGAHLHGCAGDIAAARLGTVSMIASDIIDSLPAAFMRYTGDSVDQQA